MIKENTNHLYVSIFHCQQTTGDLLSLSLCVPVVVGVELDVEVGHDGALHHPSPQQQGALHQLLPLHIYYITYI